MSRGFRERIAVSLLGAALVMGAVLGVMTVRSFTQPASTALVQQGDVSGGQTGASPAAMPAAPGGGASQSSGGSGGVAGEEGHGLGPTFNSNSCASCHAQPDVGGTSPHPTLGQVRRPNPQVAMATLDRVPGGNQTVPSFIRADGPVREARFINKPTGTKDGGVHGLYTIAGRIDAAGCIVMERRAST